MRYMPKTATEIQMPFDAAHSKMLRKIVCRLAEASLGNTGAADDIELAVGEAFSNAVKYGESDGKVRIRVETQSRREVAVEMAYPGDEFDTTVTYPADVVKREGGLGRYIIQEVMDSMEYRFRDGDTILRMTRRLA